MKTIDANLSQVGSFGGASVKRIHKPVNDEGKTAEDKGVQFVMETAATELVVTDGKVTGVKTGDTTYTGKAVILSLIHILQNQGWGTLLLKTMADRYPQVRQKILLSDDVEKTLRFYRRLGWQPVSELHCQALIKIIR